MKMKLMTPPTTAVNIYNTQFDSIRFGAFPRWLIIHIDDEPDSGYHYLFSFVCNGILLLW